MQMSLFNPGDLKEQKIELIKHSAAIHIKATELSLVDRKIINILLKNAYSTIDTAPYHTITMAELRHSVGWKSKNHTSLKASLRRLLETKIEWNILRKDKKNEWAISTLLASARILGGKCTYDYSYHLKQLLKNPNIYGKINLLTQNNFRSKYSLILWEYLSNYISKNDQEALGTDWINIKDYRDLMGVTDGQYSTSKELNFNLIQSPVKDINKLTDIEVEAKFQKNVRAITAVRFIIKKQNKTLETQAIDGQDEKETIKDKLLNFCKLSSASVDQILDKYDAEQLAANIKYIESEHKRGVVKNISAYSVNAIKNDFRLSVEEQKPEKKEELKEIKTLRENLRKSFIHHPLDYDIYLNGNDIKKTEEGFIVLVSKDGEEVLKTKYNQILDKFKINLESKESKK
jgi:hypothetical protein